MTLFESEPTKKVIVEKQIKKVELKYTCQHCGKKVDKLQEPTRLGKICISCYLDII